MAIKSSMVCHLRYLSRLLRFRLFSDGLGRILLRSLRDEAELARVERHLTSCPACVDRAEAMTDYIMTMKDALRLVQSDDSHGVQ